MFDKNLLLQHIANRQRTVEEMLSEAKEEGELHGRLKQAISKHYGIDPNHRSWSKIKPHADISKYGENVYDHFPDEIDAKYHGDSDRSYDREGYTDPAVSDEAKADFLERLGDMHHELSSKKKKVNEENVESYRARMDRRRNKTHHIVKAVSKKYGIHPSKLPERGAGPIQDFIDAAHEQHGEKLGDKDKFAEFVRDTHEARVDRD